MLYLASPPECEPRSVNVSDTPPCDEPGVCVVSVVYGVCYVGVCMVVAHMYGDGAERVT